MTSVSEEYGFYHICSDGNALPWLFKDDEDFIAIYNSDEKIVTFYRKQEKSKS